MNDEHLWTLIVALLGICGTALGSVLGYIFSSLTEKRRFNIEIKLRTLAKTEQIYLDTMKIMDECPILHMDADGKRDYKPTTKEEVGAYLVRLDKFKDASGFTCYACKEIHDALEEYENDIAPFFIPNYEFDKTYVHRLNVDREKMHSLIRAALKVN
jgi:hypothetical protein